MAYRSLSISGNPREPAGLAAKMWVREAVKVPLFSPKANVASSCRSSEQLFPSRPRVRVLKHPPAALVDGMEQEKDVEGKAGGVLAKGAQAVIHGLWSWWKATSGILACVP